MMNFYRFASMRMFGGRFLGFALVILLVVAIVLLIVLLASRKYKTPTALKAPAASAAQDRFLVMLAEQKAASGMGEQEFEERRLILEGARADNHANAQIVALKERYARGELTTGAFVEARLKDGSAD
jgi:uncharacterized membrane protein